MMDSYQRSQNSQSSGKDSGGRATHATLQGLPQVKPEMVAIETELTISGQEITIQKVKDAFAVEGLVI